MSIDDFKNRVILGDNVETMKQMPNESVHLVVTSPPYFVDMEYEDIKKSGGNMIGNWNRYLNEVLYPVFEECYRLLVPGGHLWINIDDSHSGLKSELKKNIVLPTHAALVMELSKKYDYKEMVLWKKARGAKSSGGSGLMMGSFGRFGSPGSIPIVQECEYVLWFKKPGMRKDINDDRRKESALTKEQFKEYGMQIWEIKPERAKKIGHPAPYPIELPKRCIALGSFKNDIILDPFGGSATTALACIDSGRNYICLERMEKYVELAEARIKAHTSQQELLAIS